MRLARRWTCVFLWIAIVFRSSVRGTWTVAWWLQSAAGWYDGKFAATFPGTIQWGFYHHVAALESRSGKIATATNWRWRRDGGNQGCNRQGVWSTAWWQWWGYQHPTQGAWRERVFVGDVRCCNVMVTCRAMEQPSKRGSQSSSASRTPQTAARSSPDSCAIMCSCLSIS